MSTGLTLPSPLPTLQPPRLTQRQKSPPVNAHKSDRNPNRRAVEGYLSNSISLQLYPSSFLVVRSCLRGDIQDVGLSYLSSKSWQQGNPVDIGILSHFYPCHPQLRGVANPRIDSVGTCRMQDCEAFSRPWQ
ncbi:hypothetical protein J6590_016941 [Homalodisca vitripennis]|nr:hypothetical protein J6590_016941 [Homalodisca vitripennis]